MRGGVVGEVSYPLKSGILAGVILAIVFEFTLNLILIILL